MNPLDEATGQRLDQIATQWSLLRLAHDGVSLDTEQARRSILLKYNRAIRSYVGALLQNDEDADEVSQDVLVRLLRGDFANAHPEKGRFRNFLKTAVKNMVRTHWSRKQRRAGVDLDVDDLGESTDRKREPAIDVTWQRSVIDLTMNALERFERENAGCVYHALMRLRTEYPQADSAELASRLAQQTSRTWTAEATRQQLRRARLRFAQLLVEEVAASLHTREPAEVESELIDLGLFEHVRPFLPDDWATTGCLKDMSQ